MPEVVSGNVVGALFSGEVKYILHVCNNKGVMGSGVAKEIKERIPKAFEAYKQASDYSMGSVTNAEGVFNLVAQNGYGKGVKHLNYGALAQSINRAFQIIHITHYPPQTQAVVGVPYGMGAVRAGGDWEVVKELLEFFADKYRIKLVYYKL